jgi:xanthine/CO dehydrogenase XdhC/CoxF family maturation factor
MLLGLGPVLVRKDMSELDAILNAWRGLRGKDADADAVLATVVHVTGSAYRSPGGRMLIVPNGRHIGCVSGGCLEGEITKKAWWFTESGEPVVRVYDTTSDDGAVWEFGLGCNGVVHVLLERVNTPASALMLDFLSAHRMARKPVAIATVVRADACSEIRIGDRLMLDESSAPVGSLASSAIAPEALSHAVSALHEKKSRLAHIGAISVFVEYIRPALSLAVFGAGHDAVPLVNFASQLGWEVAVLDGRPAYARPERFPGASRVVQIAAADPLREVVIDSDTAVVMMTHNYPLDLTLLPYILSRRPCYLGMLGPRARAEKLFVTLGLSPPASVHAPAGLDAGCDSPAAIALSITAEIQAVISSRPGGMLKRREEPIHAPAHELGSSPQEETVAAVRPSYCETTIESHA